MYYTPGQVSEMLGIPVSTLRNYSRTFSEYLSSQDGRKQRLYTERDTVVFSMIKDLSAQNIPISEIGPRLVVVEPVEDKPQPSALALVPSIAAELEDSRSLARSALSKVVATDEKTELLAAQLAASLEDQSKISAKINNYLSLPWWKRLFYKFPDE